jgi:hypothetical protein
LKKDNEIREKDYQLEEKERQIKKITNYCVYLKQLEESECPEIVYSALKRKQSGQS